MKRLAVTFTVLLLCAVNAFAQGSLAPIPQLTSPVTDLTGSLDASRAEAIRQKLLAFEREKGAQVAVLLVATTRPEEIEQYSIRVVENWKLGRKKINDGVLLLIATSDRTLRIEVAYGLEGALTDLVSKRIIDDIIVPHFKAGDVSAGVDAGVDAILKVVSGEELPAPEARYGTSQGDPGNFIFPLIIITALGSLLRAAIGAGKAGAICGVVATLAASFYLPLIVACLAGLAVFVLVGAGVVGGGGSGGGFSSSGSSGSSYGGGGGSFGGGGASGRW